MKVPNAFIVGAPRSGTSALYEYLAGHPLVHAPPVKEPNFFVKELPRRGFLPDREAYLRLYSSGKANAAILLDGSVSYMYFDSALEGIRHFNPEARILVMVRDPVDLVRSWYRHLRFIGTEAASSFEEGWWRERERSGGGPQDPRKWVLNYPRIGRIGTRLLRVFDYFPDDRVLVIRYEDFAADPRKHYCEVLEFLGLRDDQRVAFPRVNGRRRQRSQLFGNLLLRYPGWRAIGAAAYRVGGMNIVHGLVRLRAKMLSLGTIEVGRGASDPPLSVRTEEDLNRFFAEERGLIQGVTKRAPATRTHQISEGS